MFDEQETLLVRKRSFISLQHLWLNENLVLIENFTDKSEQKKELRVPDSRFEQHLF